jgi:hypothetical protein
MNRHISFGLVLLVGAAAGIDHGPAGRMISRRIPTSKTALK